LRKRNVAVVFATQSLADIERSSIAPALIESCPTRIFLPNERALEPQARAVYERFGLNTRQIEILSTATPKRDYYAQTARGNRLFELGLGPVALSLCGASSPDDQQLIDRCLAVSDPRNFAARFLAAKGLGWAADLLAGWQVPAAIPPPLPMAGKEVPQPEMPVTSTHRQAKSATDAPAPDGMLLPGLPGGAPLPQRLSPFRVTPAKAKGAGK